MKLLPHLSRYDIILASKSPRRQNLLKALGVDFEVMTKEINEAFPSRMKGKEVPEYLARKKSDAFKDELNENALLITSDTVVCLADHILNKPGDEASAEAMLLKLSGKHHRVITAVHLYTKEREETFSVSTDVYFKHLREDEIKYYVSQYKPYDKAGAYGIQEWIGYIGIERIEGSFYNVMGFPVKEVYEALHRF